MSKMLYVILQYLNRCGPKKQIARSTLEAYIENTKGWGRSGKKLKDRLWDELRYEEHLQLAQINAQYFSKEKDPIRIIQSIR
jgi:hypothetical protein